TVGHVVEDLVPVVRGGRGTRGAEYAGGDVAVELEQVEGEGVAVAGAGAGRPEDVQGDHGLDRDRLAGAGGEGAAEGRQEGAVVDRGRVEVAGEDRPGELVGGRQLVGDQDVAGRPGAVVGDGDGEGRRVARVDHVRETVGDRLDDLEVGRQRHTRRRP